ncbi:hypothetical protein [Poriferisphaera sp. WC338]|uniref:hypothetical protein n=1 Tax=Poriferisphaera sp. WC338 TaxID=3425129 RepID=UPI003D817B95
MLKRMLYVGVAVIAAGIILAVTLLLDATSDNPDQQAGAQASQDQNETQAQSFRPIKREDIIDNPTQGGMQGGIPISKEGIRDVTYTFFDDNRQWNIRTARFTFPSEGVIDFVKPSARIIFKPNEEILVKANSGRAYAPDGNLNDIKFKGDVIITYYKSPLGTPIDFKSNRHILMRTYLDNADFDNKYFKIDSTGPVHLVGPYGDFRGNGLSIRINDLENRLDKLVIATGEYMRVKTNFNQNDNKESQPNKPQAQASTQPATQTTKPSLLDEPQESSREQYYRASFTDNVKINTDNGNMFLTGDFLEFFFGVQAAGNNLNQDNDDKTSTPATPKTNRIAATSPTTEPDLDQTDDKPLYTYDPKTDIEIKWTGSLIVEPDPQGHTHLTSARDAMMQLTGTPVQIHTPKNETVTGTRVSYLRSTAKLLAIGSKSNPLKIYSPELGTLWGKELVINQRRASGYVTGPGTIDVENNEDKVNELAGTKITWLDRLDLKFYLKDNIQPVTDATVLPLEDDRADLVDAVKTAAFHGKVAATSNAFDINADDLTIELSPKNGSKQTPEFLQANGDVKILVKDDKTSHGINAQSLDVTLTQGPDGEAYPTRMIARDKVHADLPGYDLRSGLLDITLLPPPAQNAQALIRFPGDKDKQHPAEKQLTEAKAKPENRMTSMFGNNFQDRIRTLTAEDNVHLNIEEDNIKVTGNRVAMTGITRDVEISGNAENPAIVNQNDQTYLTGNRIELSETTGIVNIPGKGSLDHKVIDEDGDTTQMTINWQKSMNFNYLEGDGVFDGDVIAITDKKESSKTTTASKPLREDVTELRTPRLIVAFETNKPTTTAVPQTETAQNIKPTSKLQSSMAGQRIQLATAEGKSKFKAISYRLQPDGKRKLEQSLDLDGPTIIFDGKKETVTVPGAGTILIRNYSSKPADKTDSTTNLSMIQQLDPSGNGETLFQWQDQFVLDLKRNDMIMNQDVVMIHRPPSKQDIVQLDTDKLYASFSGDGGLGSMMSASGAPQMDITLVQADGNVWLQSDEAVIKTDHLQYTKTSDSVLLYSDAGRNVYIKSDKLPFVPPEASQLKWDLAKNRITAREVKSGFVPIPKR